MFLRPRRRSRHRSGPDRSRATCCIPISARRAGKEEVTYFDARLEPVLKRTLGVPLFQEQMLKIAMVMADFTGSEAEELRRALSFHRSQERMEKVCVKLRAGMEKKGVTPEVAEQICQAVQSFAVYGFPESHAISFAPARLCQRAGSKCIALPNFLPACSTISRWAFIRPPRWSKTRARHGLRVLPVSVQVSEWRCTIEGEDAVRLGFCIVRGLKEECAVRLLAERARGRVHFPARFQAADAAGRARVAHPGAASAL